MKKQGKSEVKHVWIQKKTSPRAIKRIRLFWKRLVKKKKLKFSSNAIQTNCLIKNQSLFEIAAILTSFFFRIINLTIRLYRKSPIRNTENLSEICNDISAVK